MRLALTLIEPKNPDVARELADELAFQHHVDTNFLFDFQGECFFPIYLYPNESF